MKYISIHYSGVITKKLIVEGITSKKGEQVKPTIISDAIHNRGNRYLKPLYQNIVRLLNEENDDDGTITDLLADMGEELDPNYVRRLSIKYIKRRILGAKRVYIFNGYIPNIRELAPLLSGRDNIRIMTLSPESRFLPQRARELDQSIQFYNSKVTDDLATLIEKGVSRKHIKLYNGLPSTPFYIFDDDIYCGFFLHGILAADSPQRKYDANSPEGKLLLNEFNTMWQAASDLPNHHEFSPPRHEKVQAFLDLMPGMERDLTPRTLRGMGDDMKGVYRFARYRASSVKDNTKVQKDRKNKPIVTGWIQIHPYDHEEGIVRFTAKIPNSFRASTINMHDVNGVVMPYQNFVILIGETSDGKNPVFVGMQKFDTEKYDPKRVRPMGLLLRRHPRGLFVSGRVIFKKVPYENIETAQISHDLNNPKNKQSIYISTTDFEKEFGHKADKLRFDSNSGSRTLLSKLLDMESDNLSIE